MKWIAPVYRVAIFRFASRAVTVMVSETPDCAERIAAGEMFFALRTAVDVMPAVTSANCATGPGRFVSVNAAFPAMPAVIAVTV